MSLSDITQGDKVLKESSENLPLSRITEKEETIKKLAEGMGPLQEVY